MFNADAPISSSHDDILGRGVFAKSLAGAINGYEPINSLAIGLHGEWGSGKTSIINLMLEELQKSDNKSPLVFKFNPWHFSDQDQLINQFFKQLSHALEHKLSSEQAREIGGKLQEYASYLEPMVLIPKVGLFAGLLAKVLKSVGGAAKTWGNKQSQDLESIKNDISELIVNYKRKVLIVIDDIDRLSNNEIRQIFQLVKSLGDFKNTIYLLSFDKDVVIKALSKVQEGDGLEYLEKVVQVPFDVPKLSKTEIVNYLCKQIDEVLEGTPEKNGIRNTGVIFITVGLRIFLAQCEMFQGI